MYIIIIIIKGPHQPTMYSYTKPCQKTMFKTISTLKYAEIQVCD